MTVYALETVGYPAVKIGHTNGSDILARVKGLQTGCPLKLKIVRSYEHLDINDECAVKKLVKAFTLAGGSEWFGPLALLTLDKYAKENKSDAHAKLVAIRKSIKEKCYKEMVLKEHARIREGIERRNILLPKELQIESAWLA